MGVEKAKWWWREVGRDIRVKEKEGEREREGEGEWVRTRGGVGVALQCPAAHRLP